MLPSRLRKDSVDDLGGILSRFEAPLACRHLKSVGTILPPRVTEPAKPKAEAPFTVKVKTIRGRCFSVPCSPNTLGNFFKSLIRPETAAITGQRLIHRGLDVDDSVSLQEQGIDSGSVVYRIRLFDSYTPMVDPSAPPITTLQFICENGQQFSLEACDTDSIADIRRRIDEQYNMLLGYTCRLFYQGVALGERPYANLQRLESYGIPDHGNIYMFSVRLDTARN
jgi:hypothetical protein